MQYKSTVSGFNKQAILFVSRFPNSITKLVLAGSNKRGQAEKLPRCSFVANATSLAKLQFPAYRERYVAKRVSSEI